MIIVQYIIDIRENCYIIKIYKIWNIDIIKWKLKIVLGSALFLNECLWERVPTKKRALVLGTFDFNLEFHFVIKWSWKCAY